MDHAVFFRFTAFSHTNTFVLNHLKLRFPNINFVDIDVRPEVKLARLPILLSIAEAAVRYGPRRLMGDGGKAIALRTRRGWDYMSQAASKSYDRLQFKTKPLFTFQTQTIFDASMPDIPHFVYTDHAYLANLYYPSFKLNQLWDSEWIEAEAQALRKADTLFVMSKHVETALRNLYHIDQSHILRVGAGRNTSHAATARGAATTRPPATVLFVGLHWERKGGPTLIKAMDIVVKQRPDARLIIVGCTPGVERPYVEIAGRVPLDRVMDYYEKATLFCLPTRIEPFGIVALEAMACRLPPVLPNLGAFPDFVEDGKTGYLFKPEDEQDLARVILHGLNQDKQALDDMGRQGQRLVDDYYAWDKVVDRIANHIEMKVPAVSAHRAAV